MNKENRLMEEAIEVAKQLHNEHIVIDSLSPSIIDEWVLTPAMVEIAKSIQADGGTRPMIKAAMAEYLLTHCCTDAELRAAYIAFWQRSGVTGCNHTLYASGPPDAAWESTMTEIGRLSQLLGALQGEVSLATTAEQVQAAHAAKQRVVFYNLQNAEPVGDNFGRVNTLYGMGVRSMQLTYNLRTRFGEGCLETNDGGISRLGQALVQKMNEVGMLVDLSHGSTQTARDILSCSSQPVIASHIPARAISGHARGLPDDVLRAIADGGGYAGVLTVPAFVLPPEGDPRAQALGRPAGWATLDTFVDHIQHFVNVMGADHVGIGTDWGKPYYSALTWDSTMVGGRKGFDWVGWREQDHFDPNGQTEGFVTWDQWINLTAAMLRRGISKETVIKLIGGNFLRVFRQVCG
ncbi:dipeptidase [Allopusillimonas soli]|uniref:Membrane dipeptidase n=1 Tax=Allopusillimonas soli TaxID=659016 RepID=A0A853F6S0_9BURK|nr:membrane dipeptidase [Allopusillimonas soli]NYT36275.1 membrane dipeptidase [Allopusillimonas soli]